MELIDIAILKNIKGLGTGNIIKILNYCKSYGINSVYEIKNIDLSNIVSKKLSDSIYLYLESGVDNLYRNVQKLLDNYKKDGIHCICINDKQYPEILKNSSNPPVILYCKGNIELLTSNCVAVIGTRENTTTGEKIASKTVEFLVKNDFTIVSGLAKGIDAIAHKITIANKGKTIAVLPLIDTIYPAENKTLADEILLNNGLLLSEEKPNTKFFSAQLVKRDRIQSGLSNAVFVIETSIDGGSMHATKDALKLKRAVFTPDIYSLDENYQNLNQVAGVKNLIDLNQSISYTSKNYEEIISKLNKKQAKETLW